MKTIEMYDLIIIGGGASGMMAGCIASAQGKKVAIFEKNASLGEKLKITGGGRCNITNATYETSKLLKKYGDAEQFLYSPFSQFAVQDTFSFFEKLGMGLVVQGDNRVFPHTEKAYDVYEIMYKTLQSSNVKIHTNSKVVKIEKKGSEIDHIMVKEKDTEKVYQAKSYILATGGMSHPETGSTGDGFKWLENLGHHILPPTPTLVPVLTKESWSHTLAGTSLDNMKITFFLDGKKSFSKKGKLLFTHVGLSGPLILNSAVLIADMLHAGIVTAAIDCFPMIDHGALEDTIITIFDTNKNKLLKNVLPDIVPKGLTPGVLVLLKDSMGDTKVHSVTKEDRKALVQLLKALPITITGLQGYDKAVIADGGVPLTEIDTKTMRSKVVENLFITGDLLHVRRPTGGYSLQLCWTTGYVAGIHA